MYGSHYWPYQSLLNVPSPVGLPEISTVDHVDVVGLTKSIYSKSRCTKNPQGPDSWIALKSQKHGSLRCPAAMPALRGLAT